MNRRPLALLLVMIVVWMLLGEGLSFGYLLLGVALDVLRSNINVARIVLGLAPRRDIHSAFLDIPLELRDPHALSILAAIVTATPGAAWAGVSEDGATLTLHVLDLKDEAEWIGAIKERYERPLMRIFE
jgi:multicomponent K+:H+ antiporter subunit E